MAIGGIIGVVVKALGLAVEVVSIVPRFFKNESRPTFTFRCLESGSPPRRLLLFSTQLSFSNIEVGGSMILICSTSSSGPAY